MKKRDDVPQGEGCVPRRDHEGIGSSSAGRKIPHPARGSHAACPLIVKVSPQHRVRFASEAEAQAAGYRFAGICP